jgi:hypothetical protein
MTRTRMSKVEQRRDAGMDARGRATQGAVAEQLPTRTRMSEVEQRREQLPTRTTQEAPGAARRGDGAEAARSAKARRNAWLLAGLAVFFYVAYLLWMVLRARGGV